MAPIRVGIIGLSTTSVGTNWGAIAHLPYLQSSSKYEIVALCNSSVDKAKASIKEYKLAASTKAYGSPDDLANDADVDLAVCVVGVERHYELLKPMLQAGKDIYTELPLAQTMDQVRELESLAREKGVRTMFGMQGQTNPAVNAIKRVIEEGKIGKVLSSTVTAYAEQFTGGPATKGISTIYSREVGANLMTVWFLHSFNFIIHVLGELESFDSILGITHPTVPVYADGDADKTIIETMTATSPDQVLLQGRFQSGTLLSYHLEGGKPFPGEPALKWHIVGEEGELLITNPMALLDILHAGAKIVLKEARQKETTDVEIPANADIDKVQHPAQNVGRMYEAFADKTGAYPDLTTALRRHELIDEIYRRWDGKQPYGAKAEYLAHS